MNCKQANEISIPNFLSRVGCQPIKTARGGNELWYISPLRKEKTPSLMVTVDTNQFQDFGIDTSKRSFVDLICLMYQESVRDALKRISYEHPTPTLSKIPLVVQQPKKIEKKVSVLQIEKIIDLTAKGLYWYLSSRFINLDIAKQYLKEVHYTNLDTGSKYYALAFKNSVDENGAYEFRNKYMKGFLGEKKGITEIYYKPENDLIIFEGFMDFLSYLSENEKVNFFEGNESALILNSTAFKKEALTSIKKINFKEFHFYLDNDETGTKAFEFFSEETETPCIDKASHYKGFNDYNEYWQSKNKGV